MSQVLEAEPWDHTYKGDSFWLKVRKETLRLIQREVAVNWQDVQADPWFQKESLILEPNQWDRACIQRLVPNRRPTPVEDTADFVRFFVEGKGGRKWYLSLRNEMHCAAETAVRKEHLAQNRIGQNVRRIRETWNATEEACERCKKNLVLMSQ